jgi:AcrR family transcriptional regulator
MASMPYRPGHREQTRARILRSAQVLFNRHGFNAVSIDDLMEHAGLTRGGFYKYFRSKSALYAETVALSLAITPWSQWDGISVDFAADDAATQVINAYLSRQHYDDVDASCPMITLPGDVARSNVVVKRAFEQVFRAMASLFEKALGNSGGHERDRALAITSICVGAMVVARSVASPDLADAIREATRSAALALGGWHKGASTKVSPDRGQRGLDRKPKRRRGPAR